VEGPLEDARPVEGQVLEHQVLAIALHNLSLRQVKFASITYSKNTLEIKKLTVPTSVFRLVVSARHGKGNRWGTNQLPQTLVKVNVIEANVVGSTLNSLLRTLLSFRASSTFALRAMQWYLSIYRI
jgi:hypothetical protein